MQAILGHHHMSMMTKNATENAHFYSKIMGMRLVKKTVNQEDPSMYHLFYGDLTGSPGTMLTFFEMPRLGRTHRGTNAITRIGLFVQKTASLYYWQERFAAFGVQHGEITTYANRPALHFTDPDGLALVLMVGNGETATYWEPWPASSVPEENQICGLGTVEITASRWDALTHTLKHLLGYHEVSHTESGIIFQAAVGQGTGEILIQKQTGHNEKPGRGSVHHVAIRVKDDTELRYWQQQIRKQGFHTTEVLDRYYFKSLYFRESNGVLFEIATDGPGFSIAGQGEETSKELSLPPFLEEQRSDIEAILPPIGDKEE